MEYSMQCGQGHTAQNYVALEELSGAQKSVIFYDRLRMTAWLACFCNFCLLRFLQANNCRLID
jgi:hypothetical protein